jgi:sensor histidine kinase YesM
MIFLPFVENAFKHGVSAVQSSFINISVEQKDYLLQLKVSNTINKEQNSNLEASSGIGLNNTRRRLDLLYPGKYTLLINENTTDNIYSVHLTLDLS